MYTYEGTIKTSNSHQKLTVQASSPDEAKKQIMRTYGVDQVYNLAKR